MADDWFGEASDGWAGCTGGQVARGPRRSFPPFPYGVGEGDQVIFVGMSGQWPGVANQFPAARRGDPAGVHHTQVPRMRLTHNRQGAHHSCGIRVDEGQRRHGVVRAPGPAAATGNIHAVRLACDNTPAAPDTQPSAADVQPLRSGP